ncbi:MAG: long-chain acyl-CoA synthetase, partial [Sphingomonadales bacterium]|nr:long-chain acyl-CoA synthetase [Sphingomonadales bacterium]
MSAPDPERLHAAADRGMLAAFWAGENGEHPAIISEAGDRTRAELNANANRLVRALRKRGVKAGDGIALMCSNRPEFAETIAAAQRAGLRLTTVNWHLTSDEAGYIVDDSEATAFVADARFAKVAREAADLAPRLRVTIAVGGDIEGFEEWGAVLAAEPGEDIDDPRPGATMLYTSGTTRRPKGVRRPPDPRGALGVARLTQYRGQRHMHLCTGPLYHAAPLSFSLTAPAAMGVPIVMMDGW